MLAGNANADGTPDDPTRDKEFCTECSTLQRMNSPYLLRFFGFGTTLNGKGFIVTELMANGSLHDVLHDRHRDLPWTTRVSIGMQVSFKSHYNFDT